MYSKLFENILQESFNAKFNRILQKAGFYNNHNAMDFCTITAFRDIIGQQKVPLQVNRQRNRDFEVILKEFAQKKGYGYRHQGVTGGFVGTDSHGNPERTDNEESYIITHNPKDPRSTSKEFYNDMTTLAGVATQASVLIKLATWPIAKLINVHRKDENEKTQTYTDFDKVLTEPDENKVFNTGKARLTTSQDKYYTRLKKRGKNGVGANEKSFSFADDEVLLEQNKLIFSKIIGGSLVETFLKEKNMQNLRENIVFDVVKVLKTEMGDISKAKRFLIDQGYKPIACKAILDRAIELFKTIN